MRAMSCVETRVGNFLTTPVIDQNQPGGLSLHKSKNRYEEMMACPFCVTGPQSFIMSDRRLRWVLMIWIGV